jgi:Ion channel
MTKHILALTFCIIRCLALALFIAASVFTAAGLLLLLQREAGGLDDLSTDSSTHTVQYVDTLYFTVMTFATVGYGGDAPTTVLSRLIVLALTAGFLIAVPLQVRALWYSHTYIYRAVVCATSRMQKLAVNVVFY